MPKVLDPTKIDREVIRAKVLLEKRGTLSGAAHMKNELKILGLDSKHRIRAESLIEQQKRGSDRFEEAKGSTALTPAQVEELLRPVLNNIEKSQNRWRMAMQSQEDFARCLIAYNEALVPLEEALDFAGSSGLPPVESKAMKVADILTEAKGYLKIVDEKAKHAAGELANMSGLVSILSEDPPHTKPEIIGLGTEVDKAILVVRNAEMAVKEQVTSTNNFCVSVVKTVETLISDVVRTIVGWRESEDVRKVIEVAEKVMGGAVKAAQALNGEPLSAVAMQGLHLLIKGICSAASHLAAFFKKRELKTKNPELLDQIELVKEDDYIVWKCDQIKEALQWAAEPLGFIPSVGSIVVTCINAGTDMIVESIKKASQKKIEAAKKKQPDPVLDDIIDTAAEVFENTFKAYLEEAIATAKDIPEFIDKVKSPADIIATACAAILGPPLTALLAKVMPAMAPIDKQALKDTVKGGRQSIERQAAELKNMKSIDIKFSFDEQSSVEKNKAVVKNLKVGASSACLVAVSDALPGPGCVVLLGADHDPLNRQFVESLIKNGDGHEGVAAKKGGVFPKIVFAIDANAKKWIKNYWEFYDIPKAGVSFTD